MKFTVATLAALVASASAQVEEKDVKMMPYGYDFKISQDPADKTMMIFEATVPENQWLGIAFTNGMVGDMYRFVGAGDGYVEDLIGAGYWGAPAKDKSQSLVGLKVDMSNDGAKDVFKFTVKRKLDTGDEDDFQFSGENCGKEL